MIEIYFKACNIKSILWDLITYRCSKLVDYLLRVEQKNRSRPHTFQGRCWDGILFRFHTCKLLFRQSFHNGWSELTPGIAAFFPRCTLEIRFWHIYKCKGVETYFGTMTYYQTSTNFHYLWRTLHIARGKSLQRCYRYSWGLLFHKILPCPSM